METADARLFDETYFDNPEINRPPDTGMYPVIPEAGSDANAVLSYAESYGNVMDETETATIQIDESPDECIEMYNPVTSEIAVNELSLLSDKSADLDTTIEPELPLSTQPLEEYVELNDDLQPTQDNNPDQAESIAEGVLVPVIDPLEVIGLEDEIPADVSKEIVGSYAPEQPESAADFMISSAMTDEIIPHLTARPTEMTTLAERGASASEANTAIGTEPHREILPPNIDFPAYLQQMAEQRKEAEPSLALELDALLEAIQQTAVKILTDQEVEVVPLHPADDPSAEKSMSEDMLSRGITSLHGVESSQESYQFLEIACRRMLDCLGEDSSPENVSQFMRLLLGPENLVDPADVAIIELTAAAQDGTRELKKFSLGDIRQTARQKTVDLTAIILGKIAVYPTAA